MNLAFLGSGAFGLPTLQSLARDHSILAVVTQPDRPAGRGKELTPTPIAAWTAANLTGVPLLKPADINAPASTAELHALAAGADAWVIIAFGQKLGRALLAPIGDRAVNLHASLLPRWRGAAPINAAILAGDDHTGNSVITIADRMDAGLILGQSRRGIDPAATAGELHDLLAADGPALVAKVLADMARGSTHPVTQDESLVTKAPKLSRADARIDLSLPADHCRRRINGLSPWPGVTVQLQARPLKLLRASMEQSAPSHSQQPGMLLDAAEGLVACGNGSCLRLLEVQPAGGRPMPWRDFARGRTLPSGLTLTPESSSC